MPLYEYECQECGQKIEVLQRFGEAPKATCDQCGGFVPDGVDACPNCGARPGTRRFARRLLNAASGGAVALTLMACYGGAPQHYMAEPEPMAGGECGAEADDLDRDGYCAPADCDEVNADIHPGAEDPAGDDSPPPARPGVAPPGEEQGIRPSGATRSPFSIHRSSVTPFPSRSPGV